MRHLLDGDFCSPAHRKKYHERLRRSLQQLPSVTAPPAPIAGFHLEMPAVESHGSTGPCSLGFQSNHFTQSPPKYSLQLTPLFGQTFFGPTVASAAAPPLACHRGVTLLEPALPQPNLSPLVRILALAGGSAIDSGDRLMPIGAVHTDAGAPAFPLCSPPVALVARAAQLASPKITLGTLNTWTGDHVADLRHVPLASWTRANLEPLWHAGRVAGDANAFSPAVARIATRNGSCLRLTRCAPPALASPLMATDTIARGNTAPAPVQINSVPRQPVTRLPELKAGLPVALAPDPNAVWKISPASPWDVAQAPRAQAIAPPAPVEINSVPQSTTCLPELKVGLPVALAPDPNAICKIRPVSPWNMAQASRAEAIAPTPAGALLPVMGLAPVRPGLAAESDARHMTARPLEMATAALVENEAIGIPERPAMTPAMAAPIVVAALPGAFAPHLFPSDVVRPREINALPVTPAVAPLFGQQDTAAAQVAASSLVTAAGTLMAPAGPMAPNMPAFVPQAAGPRYSAQLAGREPRPSTAMPAGTPVGFAAPSFNAIGPQPAEQKLRPMAVAPPQTIATARMAFPAPQLAITGAAIGERPGPVPLDVYVQRVRSTPIRDCEWQPLSRRAMSATAMPAIWPARFEQLVLQDWRRRYPTRQVAAPPAPVGGGTRVLPMTKHLPALARLRQNAPHFVKGVAAAAFIGAIVWASFSTQTVRSTVTTDRHWLQSAIARRATIVHDDNFRTGLNLWEGRANWAKTWSHSADGFMRTGELALYRPTLKMDNYKLEFFAQIENKSVGWVFRAKDEQNYYAMKLSITEPGPRPLVSVVRYPVLNGQRGKKVQIPLPIMMHNNTPYHVALDVKGSRFRAFVEDQEIDSWNDEKLRAGGVGFFSEAGEHARLYWVKVSNNTDWLGRLCGMISGNGSSQDSADLWDPARAATIAALDRSHILDGAKNADRRRGVPLVV